MPAASAPLDPAPPADSSCVDSMMVHAPGLDIEAEIATRDGVEVFTTLSICPGSSPERQPWLRLRQTTDAEHDSAAAAMQLFAEVLASKIVDTDSWGTDKGYTSAIPDRLREVFQPYSVVHVHAAPPSHTKPR
uniref:Uncharacterized protein n=1 Tax=Peronospora matthiolae TaxID=2874970 RepID=A0AAV1TYV3_9STRA